MFLITETSLSLQIKKLVSFFFDFYFFHLILLYLSDG